MKRTATAISALMLTLAATAWELPQCTGDLKNSWKATENNWSWDAGNPKKEPGGSWLVFSQTGEDAKMTPMAPGLAWKFNRVWRDADKSKTDPVFHYIDRKLTAPARTGHGRGAPVGVAFLPEKTGAYQVTISGSASAGQPKAGHARVQVVIINPQDETVSVLADYNLNKPGGYGQYPETFEFAKTVNLEAGSALAVRLQSVNPGPAPCGRSMLQFKQFSVKQ